MHALVSALVVAFALSAAAMVLDYVIVYVHKGHWYNSRRRQPALNLLAGTAAFIVLFGIDWALFYWGRPVFEGGDWVPAFVFNLVILGAAFGYTNYKDDRRFGLTVALAAVISLVLGIGSPFWNGWWFGQDNADIMKNQLAVEMVKPEEGMTNYPETDADHMVIVGDQAAHNQANRVMNQQNIGSRYSLGRGDVQSVNGHMYWVFELVAKDWRSSTAANYKVPGYVKVDAEDPNAEPELKTGYEITLWTDGYFQSNLERAIWKEHPGVFIDDLSLEINDEGRPYYTASLNKPVVRWQEAVPTAFITVDAQTGQIVEYPLDKIPAWVDRVYSAETAKVMLDWWGRWYKAPYQGINEGNNDRFKVAGELNLVYTKFGPAWQALMTSWNADTSVQYVALLDTRSNRVRMYEAAKGLQIEEKVNEAFNKSGVNTKGLDPTALALYKVYGKLTWVSSLVANDRGGQKDDAGRPTAESFQGVGVLNGQQSDAANVIIERSKGEAFSKYATQIATGSNNSSPEANSQVKSIEGVVSSVSPPLVFGGNTFMVIRLEGDLDHLYRGQVTETVSGFSMSVAKAGDKVILSYVDTGNPIRSISSFQSKVLTGVK